MWRSDWLFSGQDPVRWDAVLGVSRAPSRPRGLVARTAAYAMGVAVSCAMVFTRPAEASATDYEANAGVAVEVDLSFEFDDLWRRAMEPLGDDAEAVLAQAGRKMAAVTAEPFRGPVSRDAADLPEVRDEERDVVELPVVRLFRNG